MTDEELATIKARADAATPGPWNIAQDFAGDYARIWVDELDERVIAHFHEGQNPFSVEHDAPFVAHAREDVPALLAEIERLRAELARVRPEPEEAPQPVLYRIIWWQSLVQGMTDGQTLEENVTREQVPARIAYHRIGLAGAIGVMIDAAPMSFVPGGDKKDE